MDLLDFRLAGAECKLQNPPKQGIPLKFAMHRKSETNPQKNGDQITSLYSVDFTISQEQDGKAVACFSLQLRYLVWLESKDPITDQGRFEGQYITDQLRPVLYEEVNHYLGKARLPLITFRSLEQQSQG